MWSAPYVQFHALVAGRVGAAAYGLLMRLAMEPDPSIGTGTLPSCFPGEEPWCPAR
ncbi:hypothetical protein CHELA1G11_13229 [Hyphomicrobiales bacterium]|nr:hypothetical protein CHELA1G11_13229 [Hyphomicrobiales bacterium]